MKGLVLGLVLSLSLGHGAGASEGQETAGLYFGQEPPGDTPVVFAPGIISKKGRYEQFLYFSPDGRRLLYSVTNSDWSRFTLRELRFESGRWSEPEDPPFLGAGPDALTACFSHDMGRAFFTSARPAYPPCDVWTSERGGEGWSEPVKVGMPVSSGKDEFEVAVSRNGTLYFSSSREGGHGDLDIYRAPRVDGGYTEVENLGAPVNTAAGDDLPFIAQDESYLVFASDREGGLGNRDLYVTFRAGGRWTEPRSLGAPINTEGFDSYPFVSLDGKHLFFTRREAWKTPVDSDIWWVSAGIIDRLREAVFREE